MMSLRGAFGDRREPNATKQSPRVKPRDCFVERISLRSIRSPRNDVKNDLSGGFRIRNYLFLLLPGYFLLVLSSCASQQPPPGGPVDTTRPAIDSVIPHHREINVPTNTKIWFQFKRDVDQASFATAFTITPYLNGTPTFHWSGHNEVRVDLPKLKDSTTYTAQLSRDLKTLLLNGAGAALASPFFLTFSTGPLIDTGLLSGFLLTPIRASPMKPSDLFVFAYDMSMPHADTLNFTHTPPDQLTQPNDQGLWEFRAMKVGHRYRVYAIGDVYRNKVYDPGVDAFGIPTGDAILDSSIKSGMYIRMSPPTDTIKPELQDVEIVDSFHIRAHFSEAIDSDNIRAANFVLNSPSSVGGGGWGVVAAFRESPEKKPSQITLVTAKPLVPNHEYTLEAIRDSIHDLSNNPLSDSAYKVTFTTPASLHTASPPVFITMGIRDSTRNISALPSFPISFSDAFERDSVEHAISLMDTGHHLVKTIFHWYDDARVYLTPADSLLSNVFYLVTIRTGGIQSPVTLIGRSAKDTLLHFHFQTANVREFGKISGTITIADSFFAQNSLSALVVQVLQAGAVAAQKILPHGEKKFEFNQIPTATYRVRAYLSHDGSGIYDVGSVQPWRFGVPSGEYPKEFDARPRWTIANIDFEVK
jgi:hypothetical protein